MEGTELKSGCGKLKNHVEIVYITENVMKVINPSGLKNVSSQNLVLLAGVCVSAAAGTVLIF